MTLTTTPIPTDLLALDARDPLAHKKADFLLPPGVIYLDGNSLGPLHRSVPARLAHAAQHEWGDQLIRSWTGDADWMHLPERVAAKLARLIGA